MDQLMWAEPGHDGVVERWILRRLRTSLDREVWSARLHVLRSASRDLLPAVLILGLVAVPLLLVPVRPPVGRSMVAGGLLASSVWMPYSLLLMRSYRVTVDSWAEAWTREVLLSLRVGWLVEEDLFLGGANIEHVAVAQDRVFVIESKYRAASRRPDIATHESDLRQVMAAARKVGVLLRQSAMSVGRPTPVLVVWGPGGRDLALTSHGGVDVIAGQDLRGWCEKRAVPQLVALPARAKIAAALAEQRSQHRNWGT